MEKDETFEALLDKEYSAIADMLIDDCGLEVAMLEECGSAPLMEVLLKGVATRQELTAEQALSLSDYSRRVARIFAAAPQINRNYLADLVLLASIFDSHLSRKSGFSTELITSWSTLVEYVSLSANLRGRISESLSSTNGTDGGTSETLKQLTDSFSSLYLEHLATQAHLSEMVDKVQKSKADRRKGADATNAESNNLKNEVFNWLDVQPPFKKIEWAATAITRQQPISHVTARKWFKEWKNLRSASGQ
jgi:hypothetical protein